MTKAKAPQSRRGKAGRGAKQVRVPYHADRPLPSAPQKNIILDAAIEEFAREGYHGAVLTDIAKRCGVAHPLIHYHFGSKENLWRAAVAYCFAEMTRGLPTFKDAIRDLTPLAALKFVSRAFIRFVAAYPMHAAIIQDETRRKSERFAWLVDNYLKPVHQLYDELIRRGVESGEVKPIEAAYLTSLLIGSGVTFFSDRPVIERLYPELSSKGDLAARFADAYIEVIFGGLENSSRRAPRRRE